MYLNKITHLNILLATVCISGSYELKYLCARRGDQLVPANATVTYRSAAAHNFRQSIRNHIRLSVDPITDMINSDRARLKSFDYSILMV